MNNLQRKVAIANLLATARYLLEDLEETQSGAMQDKNLISIRKLKGDLAWGLASLEEIVA